MNRNTGHVAETLLSLPVSFLAEGRPVFFFPCHSEGENYWSSVAKDIRDLSSHLPFLWECDTAPPIPVAWIQGFPFAEGQDGPLAADDPADDTALIPSYLVIQVPSSYLAYCQLFLIGKSLWQKGQRNPGYIREKKPQLIKMLISYSDQEIIHRLCLLLILPATRHFCRVLYKTNKQLSASCCWRVDTCMFQFSNLFPSDKARNEEQSHLKLKLY